MLKIETVSGIRYIVLTAMLCLAFMASATAEQPSTVKSDAYSCTMPDTLSNTYRHTEAVKRLTIDRDTLSARDIWREIIAKDSTYAPALYHLSRVDDDPKRTLVYAYRAFAADSTNKWYTENYASKLVASRQYARAIPIYRRLMRLDPQGLQSYHALAILYGTSGMPYSAIAILDTAEIRVGYNSYLAEIQHRLLLDTRQYDRAIETGKRRVVEHPYDSEVRTSLAMAYDAAGQDSLAIATLDEAFLLDTTNVATTIIIADYYLSKGNTRRMLDYEERLMRNDNLDVDKKLRRIENLTSDINLYRNNYLRLGAMIQGLAIDYPNNRKVVDTYASHMIAGGNAEYALDYLRRHLEDDTTTADNYIYVLELEHFLKRNDLIDSDLKRALKHFPDNAEILSFKGFLLCEQEQYDKAIRVFKSVLRNAKRQKDNTLISATLGYIGDTYHIMGNDMRCFMAYADALHYNANNVPVLNNYAYYLSLKERGLDKALAMAERAITLEGGVATYIDTYAWVLHLLGRDAEAKQQMQRALSLGGQNDPDILAHYGDILWALGEKFMAETYWKKAVDRGYDKAEMAQHVAEITKPKTDK